MVAERVCLGHDDFAGRVDDVVVDLGDRAALVGRQLPVGAEVGQVAGRVGAGDFEAGGRAGGGVVGVDRALVAGFAAGAVEAAVLGVVLGADLERVGAVGEAGGVERCRSGPRGRRSGRVEVAGELAVGPALESMSHWPRPVVER